MKGFIALSVALFLGLAGCSAATSPAWQKKAGSVAYQTEDPNASQVSPSRHDNAPAMSDFNNEIQG